MTETCKDKNQVLKAIGMLETDDDDNDDMALLIRRFQKMIKKDSFQKRVTPPNQRLLRGVSQMYVKSVAILITILRII